MQGVERVRSQLELNERARTARRGLEEARRRLAVRRPRISLRDWMITVMRLEPGPERAPDGSP